MSHWRDDAKCRTQDARLFDPAANETSRAAKVERVERVALAAAVCARCPVRERCFRTGVQGSESGVWGGVLLDNGLPVEDKHRVLPHGTDAGWARHRYHKETPCDACRDAHSAAMVKRRKERSEREYPCGTEAAAKRHYRNGEPLCAACLAVNSAMHRRKRERAARRLTPCGSHAAYVRHQRHGEPVDAACRDAERAYKLPRNRARKQRAA